MIDCVAAVCCIRREGAERLILLSPIVVWMFGSVAVAASSVKAYARIKENDGLIEIKFILAGFAIAAIICGIVTISNAFQVFLSLYTADYAMEIQKMLQGITACVFIIADFAEVLVYSTLEDPENADVVNVHIWKITVVILVLMPFTVVSYYLKYVAADLD